MSFLSSLFGRGAASDEVRPDAATSLTAARALALAGSGPDWWPYAALVSRGLLAVHVAGAAAPAPEAPWRAESDPRLWTVSRADAQSALEGGQAAADLIEAAAVPRPILLGRYPNGFVYLDVARAPGPLAVHGAEPWAEWVRELLIAQLPDGTQVLDGDEGASGAHWPVQVDEHGTISVLGVALAFGIKTPERLDLPIVPTRRTVLRELAAAARQATAPEDAVGASQQNTETRRDAVPAAGAARPNPTSEPVFKSAVKPAPAVGPQPTPKADPAGTRTRRQSPPAPAPVPTPVPTPAPTATATATAKPAAPTAASKVPATPAATVRPKPAAPAAPAAPAVPALPAASNPARRHLPAELYEAPAISAAAPAPAPAAATPAPAPASPAAGQPKRPQPIPPHGSPVPPVRPAAVEWNDVAVSSADDKPRP